MNLMCHDDAGERYQEEQVGTTRVIYELQEKRYISRILPGMSTMQASWQPSNLVDCKTDKGIDSSTRLYHDVRDLGAYRP